MEFNNTEKHSLDDLADRSAIDRRYLGWRFKKATNNTPAEYVQRVKVKAAKKQLENSSKNG